MEFAYDGGGLGKGGTVTLYRRRREGRRGPRRATVPMVFSADETCDVGSDTGTPVSDDYRPSDSAFTGAVNWVQIDLGDDAEDVDHLISPELKLTVPAVGPALGDRGARPGPARRRRSARSLLRHARTSRSTSTASSSARGACRARATTRWSSSGPWSRPSCRRSSASERGFGVEVDAMPGGFVCSASLKGAPRGRRVRETVRPAARPLRKLFSKEQRALLRRARPGGPRARRPLRPRPDLRPQAEVRPGRARPQARRGAVAVPGRVAHPRAARRSARRPRPSRSRPRAGRSWPARGVDLRRAGDEDA